jgi:hypothetical protein
VLFPDVIRLLINAREQLVGEICHIEAAMPVSLAIAAA